MRAALHSFTKFLREEICAFYAAGAMIGSCIFLLVIHPDFFWIDDMQSQHIPAYMDMANAIREGSFPLITPYSWNGGRIAGELQYGIFSTFQLLLSCIICNLPISMSSMAAFFCMTYLVVLSMGTYALARVYQLPRYLCFLMATSLPLSGFLILWGTKTWFPILMSFAWLPWAWAALHWTLKKNSRPISAVAAGIFIYLVIAGGWPFTDLMIALVALWLVCSKAWEMKSLPKLKFFILACVIGFLLSAPTIAMFLDAMRWNFRGSSGVMEMQRTWLVPFTALWGLILPTYETFWHEFIDMWVPRASAELFCGISAPAIFIFAVWNGGKKLLKKVLPELIFLGIVLFLASFSTPQPLQHSFRWLPLFHLAFLLVAARIWYFYTTDEKHIEKMNADWKGLAGTYTLCACVMGITMAILFMRIAILKIVYTPQLKMASFFMLAIVFTWILASRLSSARVNQWLMPVISLISLIASLSMLPNPHRLPEWNIPEKIRATDPYKKDFTYLGLMDFDSIYNDYNKYSHTERALFKFGNFPLTANVKFINGYSPTYPIGTRFFFAFRWSGFMEPPTMKLFLEHPELYDVFGIDGVLIPKTLKTTPTFSDKWRCAYQSQNLMLYERLSPVPMVLSIPQAVFTSNVREFVVQNKNSWSQYLIESPQIPAQTKNFASANISSIEESRMKISLNAQNPDSQNSALLVFKRAWYPGYRAYLDGKELKMLAANLCMPAVEIPPLTSGRLTLCFWPHILTPALAAAALGFLLSFYLSFQDLKKRFLN